MSWQSIQWLLRHFTLEQFGGPTHQRTSLSHHPFFPGVSTNSLPSALPAPYHSTPQINRTNIHKFIAYSGIYVKKNKNLQWKWSEVNSYNSDHKRGRSGTNWRYIWKPSFSSLDRFSDERCTSVRMVFALYLLRKKFNDLSVNGTKHGENNASSFMNSHAWVTPRQFSLAIDPVHSRDFAFDFLTWMAAAFH